MSLSIRQARRNAKDGLLICGLVPGTVWMTQVFVEGRTLRSRRIAQWIKERIAKGELWLFRNAVEAVDRLEAEEARLAGQEVRK